MALTLFISTATVIAIVGARRWRLRDPDWAHSPRDYLRAGWYRVCPFGPTPASISAQLLRWTAAEKMPLSMERSLAPVGVLCGLTAHEFAAIESRKSGLEIALVDTIVETAQAEGRKQLSRQVWAVIEPDPDARPGWPTLRGYYDASARPPVADESSPMPQQSPPRGVGPREHARAQSSTVPQQPGSWARFGQPPREKTVASLHWFELEDRQVPLTGELLIGRGYGVDLEMLHPQVSRRHAVVHVTGAVAYLEDLGSYNGTHVNDKRVTGVVELKNGDVVKLGPDGPVLKFTSSTS